MKITRLRTNRIENPLGFFMEQASISYVVEGSRGTYQKYAQVCVAKDEAFTEMVYDSGKSSHIDSICYPLPIVLMPRCRYYWRVTVWDDLLETAQSETAWFETAKGREEAWKGYFITQCFSQDIHPVFGKEIIVTKPVKKARLYGVGLGVYELYVNGEKAGEEYLLPGIHAYDSYLQYQTFALALKQGVNHLEAMLGEGWYKGPYGLKAKLPRHGEEYALIAELHITYEDDSVAIIGTDDTWRVKKGKVIFDSIYDGEQYDERICENVWEPVKKAALTTNRLTPRISPRIVVNERLKPIAVLHTPAGETVLDMGQNMVGWLECNIEEPKDQKVSFQFGEILQNGNFYRDNLRTAKCEYTYVSDGTPQLVRPHFTFYGFRYVKIEGIKRPIQADDFTGCVIHSQMEETGEMETSEPMLNQLLSNVRWGQKGNFLDIPTDCPQRDERMGWTGDAQIFADTASFLMDTYAFYTKFLTDLSFEQEKCGGSVPYVVPMSRYELGGASTWGDAATIIPWTAYVHFGNKEILRRQYGSMKAWVNYIKSQEEKDGGSRLFKRGRHFGDWLALDGKVQGGVYGSTDIAFLATAYYYESARLTAKAAAVLGEAEEEKEYKQLAQEVKEAFLEEYYTKTGRLSMSTQTAFAVVIAFDLIPAGKEKRVYTEFKEKLKENAFKLNTGFVGTPYLCPSLTKAGYTELAYDLLLNKEYPGWLYEVKMGATTIWERWDSVLPDGTISGTGMNSLNHYAYGSVAGWMYRSILGINPKEEAPGFREVRLEPKPSWQLSYAKGRLHTPAGTYESGWEIKKDGELELHVTIPFGCKAEVVLPGNDQTMTLRTGTHHFSYLPDQPYRRQFGMDSNLNELMAIEKTREIIIKHFPKAVTGIAFQGEGTIVEEIAKSPFAEVSDEALAAMKRELEGIDEV